MSIDIAVETTIARPAEEVARFAMDPANDTVWIGEISEARVVTVGSRASSSGAAVRRLRAV